MKLSGEWGVVSFLATYEVCCVLGTSESLHPNYAFEFSVNAFPEFKFSGKNQQYKDLIC